MTVRYEIKAATNDLVDDVAVVLAKTIGGSADDFFAMMKDVAANGPHRTEHPLSNILDAADFTERNWALMRAALTVEVQELGKASIAELVCGMAHEYGGAGDLSTLEVEAALMDREDENWPFVANAIAWWTVKGVADGIENGMVSVPIVCEEMGWPEPEIENSPDLGGDDTRGVGR